MTGFSPEHMAATNGPSPFAPKREEVPAPARDSLASGPASGTPASPSPQRLAAEVKGRIDIADEVVEKIAALAAMEVDGVADLGGDIERALENVRERIGIGNKRGDQGIKAKITGREVTIDVTIMIEYGHVVMEVAQAVKTNVATQTNRMLGLRVVEVNVKVDDVKLPDRNDEKDEDFLSIES